MLSRMEQGHGISQGPRFIKLPRPVLALLRQLAESLGHPQGGWAMLVMVITITTKVTHYVLGDSCARYYYFILTTILCV